VDHIGTKDDNDTAAFNILCQNNSAGFDLRLRSNARMRNAPFTFSMDSKTIDKGIATVSGVGGPTAWVAAAARAAKALRWLNGIAGATRDITISVKSVGTGVFTFDGAETAISRSNSTVPTELVHLGRNAKLGASTAAFDAKRPPRTVCFWLKADPWRIEALRL